MSIDQRNLETSCPNCMKVIGAPANRGIAAISLVVFIVGVVLSRQIEPGVRVKTVTLAGNTPALQFAPEFPGPHPVALLAHGLTGSRDQLFRFGEALATAGFQCVAVDLPGHGASRKSYTLTGCAYCLEEVAQEVGPIDVFVGASMGAYAGAKAVRETDLNPRLFIAVGASPDLGERGPPLLLLAGRFDEFCSPASLKARTDAPLTLSPWSDHVLEPFDPVLIKAAVKAACTAVGKAPPTPPTRWRWRIVGLALGLLGGLGLAICLPQIPSPWAWTRGPLVSIIYIAGLSLVTGETVPHLRHPFLQIVTMVIACSVLMKAGQLKILLHRWVLFILAAVLALSCLAKARAVTTGTAIFILILLTGIALHKVAAHHGSRRDGNIALAIFLIYIIGQSMPKIL